MIVRASGTRYYNDQSFFSYIDIILYCLVEVYTGTTLISFRLGSFHVNAEISKKEERRQMGVLVISILRYFCF